jgi:CTP synthase
LEQEGLAEQVLKLLRLDKRSPDLAKWEELVRQMQCLEYKLKIAIVGKYIQLSDAYLSVVESITHAGINARTDVELKWVDAEDIELNGAEQNLKEVDGVIVPGGFGNRGVDGKVKAIQYARENQVPFFGLCLGMQCSVIEWGRNIAHLERANSAEFDRETPNPVINLLPEQQDVVDLGGTMRLGLYPCRLAPNTLAYSLYQEEVVYERHRHRYEFNNAYRQQFLATGYQISGTSPDGRLVEIIEYPQHPFFIATQFHPEFRSRPNKPHPLFSGFVKACLAQTQQVS